MAILTAAFSGILGFISFLTALLVLDYSFLSACAVYLAVSNCAFALTMSWASLTIIRSRDANMHIA
jgi:hypothetical protein